MKKLTLIEIPEKICSTNYFAQVYHLKRQVCTASQKMKMICVTERDDSQRREINVTLVEIQLFMLPQIGKDGKKYFGIIGWQVY